MIVFLYITKKISSQKALQQEKLTQSYVFLSLGMYLINPNYYDLKQLTYFLLKSTKKTTRYK